MVQRGFRQAGIGARKEQSTHLFLQNSEEEQRRKAEKVEDPEYAKQCGEQAIHEQEEGLQRLDSRKKRVSTCLQRGCQSWNLVGRGSIYPVVPGPDEVQNIEEPEREQRHPRIQKQIPLSTKQGEAGEGEKNKHYEAEEWRIQ